MDDSTAQVFVSYRRDDTGYVARGLGDRLNVRFGRVFMDIDDIDPGENFTDVIRRAVAECDVLLALIGKSWVGAVDAQGHRRLEDPNDWIVQEIKTALLRGVRVIPVLVDEAKMPQAGDLPAALKALTDRQASRVRLESFDDDANRLMLAIRKALSSAESPTAVIGKMESAGRIESAEPPADRSSIEAADPDYVRALGEFFAGRWEGAVELLTKLADRYPHNRNVADRLAHARQRLALAELARLDDTAADPGGLVTLDRARLEEADLDRRYAPLDGTPSPSDVADLQASARSGRRRRGMLMAAVALVMVVVGGAVVFALTRPTGPSGVEDTASAGITQTAGQGGATAAGAAPESGTTAGQSATEPTEVRTGHAGVVSGVAFNRDGTLLASAGHDGTIQLSKVADPTAAPVTLRGATAALNSVAFSPDGSLLAGGGADNSVMVWNVADPEQPGVPMQGDGHREPVTSIAFSPDGKTLASASNDDTVRLWDVNTRALKGGALTGHDGDVTGVAFSPVGPMLASVGTDGTVRLWNADTGRPDGPPLTRANDSTGKLLCVAFSKDGTTLATGSDDHTVWLWDVAGRSFRGSLTGHDSGVDSVAFMADGRTLVTGSWDGTVGVGNIAGDRVTVMRSSEHQAKVFSVAYASEESVVASASEDGSVLLWPVAH